MAEGEAKKFSHPADSSTHWEGGGAGGGLLVCMVVILGLGLTKGVLILPRTRLTIVSHALDLPGSTYTWGDPRVAHCLHGIGRLTTTL